MDICPTLEYMDMKTGEWKDALADGVVTKNENGEYVAKEGLHSLTMFRTVRPDNLFEFIDIDSGLQYFNTETSTWCDAEADGIVTRNEDGNLIKGFEASEGLLFRVVD